MLAPINTTKHMVQQSLAAVAAGAILVIDLADAVNAPSANLAKEVREGAVIKAIFLEYWMTSDDAAQSTVVVTLEKTVSDASGMTAAEAAALFTYRNKKNVLNTFQGILGPNVQVPMPVIRGWFKIPKGKQRFGLRDKLRINFLAQSNGSNLCGHAIYKEFF